LFQIGTGKSSIFNAIEYCLFNECDYALDKIIRDDTNMCTVILDIECDNEIYRIKRSRAKKASNLDLFKCIDKDSTDRKLDTNSDKIWKNISGRRSSDTEVEIAKIIKLNFNSFRNTVHFVQGDFRRISYCYCI